MGARACPPPNHSAGRSYFAGKPLRISLVAFATALLATLSCGDGDGHTLPSCPPEGRCTACDGLFVNLMTNEMHCGACGNACAPGTELCENGACVPFDAGPQ